MAHVVVIGAGSAGYTAATSLAVSGHSVTLCEAGSGLATRQSWPLLGDPTRRVYVGGSGVGGSSTINGAVLGAADDPLPVDVPSFVPPLGAVGQALFDATASSRVRVLGRDGRRLSIAEAIGLDDGVPPTMSLLESTPVISVLVEGGRTVGVRTSTSELVADAVIMAAGAVMAPIILLDSGIGRDGSTARVAGGLVDHRCLTVVVERPDETPGAARASVSAVAEVGGQLGGGHLVGVDSFGGDVDGGDVAGDDVDGGALGGVLAVCGTPSVGGSVFRSPVTGAVTVDLGPLDVGPLMTLWTSTRPILEQLADKWSGDVFVDEWGTTLSALPTDCDTVEAWIRRSVGGTFHAVGTCRQWIDREGRVLGANGLVVAGAAALSGPPRWPMGACIASGRHAATVVDRDLNDR